MSPGSLELRPGQTVNHPDLGNGVLVATEPTGPSNPRPKRRQEHLVTFGAKVERYACPFDLTSFLFKCFVNRIIFQVVGN